jgi:hypothetical protein
VRRWTGPAPRGCTGIHKALLKLGGSAAKHLHDKTIPEPSKPSLFLVQAPGSFTIDSGGGYWSNTSRLTFLKRNFILHVAGDSAVSLLEESEIGRH